MGRVARSVVVLAKAGRGGAWSPSSLTGLYVPIQWSLAGGEAYETETLDSYAVLRCLESYGTFRRPRAGRCGLFDGTNDYATLGARLTSGAVTELTACCWAKSSSSVDGMMVAEYKEGQVCWGIYRYGSGVFNISMSGDGTNNTKDYRTTATYNDGEWHHIAFTFSAGILTMYVDGEAVAAPTKFADGAMAAIYNGTSPFTLGCLIQSSGNPVAFHDGSIRDVRVYSVAKSAAEIEAIYNQADTPETVDTTGLLGGWWLNEEAGTVAYDWSGNGKHLTLTNITTSTFHASDTGVTYNPANHVGFGLPIFFDGTDDYAACPGTTLTGTGDFTITAWINANAVSTAVARTIIGSYGTGNAGGFQLMSFQNKLTFYLGANTQGATTLSLNTWYHVAAVRSSGVVTLYVNGVSDGSGTRAASIVENTPARIGANTSNTEYWSGLIGDVCVYNVAKTGSEVLAIKNGDSDTTGLLGRWSGKRDLSGNGRHLALSGAAELIIPRNEASTLLDAAGIPLQYTGRCPHPQVVETRCITIGSITTMVNLGPLFPASADFSFSFRYYHASTGFFQRMFDSANNNNSDEIAIFSDASGGTYSQNSVRFYDSGSTDESLADMLVASEWHTVTLARSGSILTLTITKQDGTSKSMSKTRASALDTASLLVFNGANVGGSPSAQNGGSGMRLCDARFTTGGVTTYWPMEDGPGASNTNRDLSYVKSDGTYGVVSGAIVNGTVSTIWANRCPGYARDWCTQYGGRLTTQNAVQYSDQFDNAAWTVSSATVSANAAASPDGTVTADLVYPGSSGSFRGVYQIFASLTGPATLIVYAKAAGKNWLGIIDQGGVVIAAWFNLATGAVGNVLAGYSASMSDVGDGWYRCAMTYEGSGGYVIHQICVTDADNSSAVAPNGTDGVYLWRARVKAGVDDYTDSIEVDQPTTTAAIDANRFIPGQISGSLCADGRAKTLTAGKSKNPGSRIVADKWAAPELAPLKLPAYYPDLPCITGDGSGVYAGLGELGTASDFTATLYYYQANTSDRYRLIDCRNDAASYIWAIAANAENSGVTVPNQLYVQLVSAGDLVLPSALTVGAWHRITLTRSGNTWTLTCQNLSTGASSTLSKTDAQVFDPAAVYYLLGAYNNAGSAGISLPCPGRLAELSITQGGVTTIIPLTDGVGTGSNRDIVKYVDGVESVISGAIVGGTPSTIWANTTSGVTHSRYAMQAIVPRNTKFRRTADDGDDRLFNVLTALTGTSKDNAEAYTA